MTSHHHANLLALGAIALWATIATLGVALSHLPPLLLTGLALLIGSLPALPLVLRRPGLWRVSLAVLALGVYGLFGFHFLLFMALRLAPPVQANLVNYLWPLLIVLLAPVMLPGQRLHRRHVIAALMGFGGAALAILGHGSPPSDAAAGSGRIWGYLLALGSALVWATYSLGTRRMAAFPTAAVGLFGLVSGLLALACHVWLEPAVALSARDWLLVTVTGIGPLGIAFYLWDRALKTGDPRQIGILSYITPLASTALLLTVSGQPFGWPLAAATALIVGGAVLGSQESGTDRR